MSVSLMELYDQQSSIKPQLPLLFLWEYGQPSAKKSQSPLLHLWEWTVLSLPDNKKIYNTVKYTAEVFNFISILQKVVINI